MRQPEDTKTLDLLEPVKRGRGRPRVENPLSPAERARRYREKTKAEGRTRRSIMSFIRDDEPVTKNESPSVGKLEARIILLNSDNLRLSQDLDSANDSLWQCQARVADLTGALHEVVQVASAGKRVPAHMLKGLVKLLADA